MQSDFSFATFHCCQTLFTYLHISTYILYTDIYVCMFASYLFSMCLCSLLLASLLLCVLWVISKLTQLKLERFLPFPLCCCVIDSQNEFLPNLTISCTLLPRLPDDIWKSSTLNTLCSGIRVWWVSFPFPFSHSLPRRFLCLQWLPEFLKIEISSKCLAIYYTLLSFLWPPQQQEEQVECSPSWNLLYKQFAAIKFYIN